MKENIFSSNIFFNEKKEWVDLLNKSTDKYINEAKEKNKLISNNDFGIVHHSNSLILDNDFNFFSKFICSQSLSFFEMQGYDLSNYSILISELWVQEFPENGGGHHAQHIHQNCHMSGFYFLKCSENTSHPLFHDPRPGKMMTQLPEKNNLLNTDASEKISIKITPGLFVFFNSFLTHEFPMSKVADPFRFIHFNLQAVPKQLVNNNYKKINDS
jgi:uncharacterized protein (TIGR02466 family)